MGKENKDHTKATLNELIYFNHSVVACCILKYFAFKSGHSCVYFRLWPS